ncbi:MAG: hypothetical protein JXO44_14290, partial [Clostridia bacterium]|nr:hypothetical protein [Clostridia bacterium]
MREVKDKNGRFDSNYHDFKTDRAKDKAYMEHHEKKAEQLSQSLKAQGLTLGGVEFFEHESRRDQLGGGLKNYTPTLLALNSSTQERIDNPKRYYLKKGIKNPLFAETVERDSTRFLSVDTETTNHAIALDNYDFFLKHNKEIRTNLARVLLAKLDLDIDHKKTLNDILNHEQWKSASGEEVFHELKNRLRQRGQDLNDQYIPIFKLLAQAEEIAGQQAMFLSERLRVQEEIYDQIRLSNDPLKWADFKDNTQKERAKELISQLSGHLHQSSRSIGKTLDELASKKENMEANELYRILSGSPAFMNQDAKVFIQIYEEAKEKEQRFVSLHNQVIEKSTQAVEKIAFKSKSYPVAILASLADEEFFLQNADRNELNDIEKNLKAELRKVLPETTDVNFFIENLKKNLQTNKGLFEHIYDASKDSFNSQRQYMPFESVKMHDTAGNIIRDALYAELMKEEDNKLYGEFFNKETEKKILSVSLDPNINQHKPKLDEVNDTFNAISMINKVTMGEVSKKDADIIFDSPIFEESTALNHEEIQGLKEFTTNLADTTKVLKSKEIIGTAKEKELQASIQEMHYLAYAQKLIDKMRPDQKEKNVFKKMNSFIGRNFFQNNKALYEMQECMKSALNPTTGVETIPSLSRNCIDKLKQEYDKEIQNATQNHPFKGWLAVSFVGFINQLVPVIAKAKKDMLNSLIDEMNAKISEDSTYTNSARNDYERQARMMNVENKNGFMANHLIATSHAGDFRDEIEKEYTALALMKTKVETPKLVFEHIWQPKEYQDSIKIKSELEQLKERSEELKKILVDGDMSGEAKKTVEAIKMIDSRETALREELHKLDEITEGRSPAVIKSELE